MAWAPWILLVGCRNWHERDQPVDTGLFPCQPYTLECPSCTLDEDLALPDPLRVWRCEDPSFGTLTGVTRRAPDVAADDEHYYGADGLRVAARRRYDVEIPVCEADTFTDEEWWGEILDCAATCEVEPTLPGADVALPACG